MSWLIAAVLFQKTEHIIRPDLASRVREAMALSKPNVVHTNLVLVRADSPEDAHRKAIELGPAGDQSYENPDGKCVTFRFRGLHNLNVIHDELEHGAELIYSENTDWDESAIRQWVTPKEELGIFFPITPSTGPDYRSRDVVEDFTKDFRISGLTTVLRQTRDCEVGSNPRMELGQMEGSCGALCSYAF